MSGLHGVEVFIGSRIQSELLSKRELWKNENPPTVLFVHNVNSFGSAWMRRTNPLNIDLNRNAWTELPSNPPFAEYRPWLSSKNAFEYWSKFMMTLPDLRKRSLREISGIVARGQSEFPDSIFHTGRERSVELSHLEKFLREKFPQAPEVIHTLDIHTGLGSSGQESLITDPPVSEEQDRQISSLFGAKLVYPEKEAGFHPAFGSLGFLFQRIFPNARLFHITHEFGTIHPFLVLRDFVLENSTWHHKGPNAPGRFDLLRETFYPSSPLWQETVLRVGVRRFHELYGFI